MASYEAIVAGAGKVWFAPAGTAEPDIITVSGSPKAIATLSNAWTAVSEEGMETTEDGVKFTFSQTTKLVRGAGSLYPLKALPTDADDMVAFTLHDKTLEALGLALNLATGTAASPKNASGVTEAAATASKFGSRRVGLVRPRVVNEVALIVRSPSGYGDGLICQMYYPRMFVSNSPESTANKDEYTLPLELTYLEHPTLTPSFVAQAAPFTT